MMIFRRRSFLCGIVVVVAVAVAVSSFSGVEAKRPSSSSSLVPSLTKKAGLLPKTSSLQKRDTSSSALTSLLRGGAGTAVSVKFCVTAGILLAFNSGYINGCCLKGTFVESTKQAVAAVTGAYTTSAIAFADGRMEFVKLQFKVLASFITGSAIGGALVPTPKTYELSENVGKGFLLASVGLFVANAMATGKAPTSNWIFYLAAMANGIQNSITSTATANLCRTSHYSGISSDIGTFTGQIIGGNDANMFKLKVFLALATSFWFGGYVSYFATDAYTTSSLIFPAIFDLLIGLWLTFAGP